MGHLERLFVRKWNNGRGSFLGGEIGGLLSIEDGDLLFQFLPQTLKLLFRFRRKQFATEQGNDG
jgi:hypothetical protein